MTGSEYRSAMAGVAWLAGCAVRQEVPDAGRLAGMNMKRLLEAARKHKLAAAVGMALESAGVRDPDFVIAAASAQRRAALLDADRTRVQDALEAAGIWYMPLKGAVLKDLYPRFGMREMVDADILFDGTRAPDVKRIMLDLGFTVEEYGHRNDDTYHREPVSSFEMHRSLFCPEAAPDLYPYYARVKDRLLPVEGKACAFRFTDEDQYLYLTAHEYKHYSTGGTGLRSLLDTYVFLRSRPVDMARVEQEAAVLGIAEFERKNRELAFHLFDGAELTPEEQEMLDYMIASGTYGTEANKAGNQVARKGRWGYFLSRLFPSVEYLSKLYPALRKAPFLYPLFWVMRMVRGFLVRRKQMKVQLKAALGTDGRKEK